MVITATDISVKVFKQNTTNTDEYISDGGSLRSLYRDE